MSEEIAAADANLIELARLRTAVRDLREINAQQQREIDAERAARRAFEADAVQLRQAALAYVRAGSYAERSRLRAELEVLATVDHPGTLIMQELEAARKVVDLVRWAVANHYAPPPMCDALAAYDEATHEQR